jgi:uncharacterized membrane protein
MAEKLAERLVLGSVASILMALGLLLMKSRGAALPAAQGANFVRAIFRWLRDPVWLAGLILQSLGFALYLFALSAAPVSMLAVMMQGGIAVFVVFATIFLRERASLREWVGIVGILAAMILLSLSLGGENPAENSSPARVAALSLAAVGLSAAPFMSGPLRAHGLAPAIASGVAFGLGSVYAKLMTTALTAAPIFGIAAILANPWVYLTIMANVAGLVLLQNSFHWARGVIAMPLSSACSNLVPIVGGVLALGEGLPADATGATMRIGAFALTILSSGFLAAVHD